MSNGVAFENLGRPLRLKPLKVEFVTEQTPGKFMAWGSVEAPDKRGVFGIDMETGKVTWLDTAGYGSSHIRVHKAENGHVYIYAGSPGRFLKYDIAQGELTDLGVPAENAHYWLGHAVGPDGVFYVGSYPATHLVAVDPANDRVRDLGRIADDPNEKYIVHPVVNNDNIVYCPVGLHHRELWAYDAKTGTKKQILPEPLTKEQGSPRVWKASDGGIYGQAGEVKFRCLPDGIEEGAEAEPAPGSVENMAGEYRVEEVLPEGQLRMVHLETGAEKQVETEFEGASVKIYSVSCSHQGKIYGGGFQRAHSFVFNPEDGKMEDLGQLSAGTIQVYDTLSHENGLFLSSYMGCNQDFYNPDTGACTHIANLTKMDEQERGQQLVTGPDGRIYTGSIPIKGKLGGSVVRIDPSDLSVKSWRNLIPNQSFVSAVSVPKTGEVFFPSTVQGGTSAIPTEPEAFVMLWDVEKECLNWKGQPVPGTSVYGRAVRARSGLIYGLAGTSYYAFDPVRRAVVHTRNLPVQGVHWPGLAPVPCGPNGLIVGLGEDAVFAIDPADHEVRVLVRDESVREAHGMFATEEGVLYFGSGPYLMRVELYPGQ